MHNPPKFCHLIAVFIINLYLNFISKIWKITYFLKTCQNCISDCIKDKLIVHSYVTLLHKSKFLYLNFKSKVQNNRNSLNLPNHIPDCLSHPFLTGEPCRVHSEVIQLWTPVFLRLDCELEVDSRGHFPE